MLRIVTALVAVGALAMPLAARSAAAAKPAPAEPGDPREVEATLQADDPKLSVDEVDLWNGRVVALATSGEEKADRTVTLAVLKRKGKKLVTVATYPVCALEAPEEGAKESHTCKLDIGSWKITAGVPAIAVIEEYSTDPQRDSSGSGTTAHLFWVDEGGLRSILDVKLAHTEEHTDPFFPNLDEKWRAEFLTSKSLGFFDLTMKGTRVSTPVVPDGPPSGTPPEGPTTTELSELYKFDGTSYSQGSSNARPTVTASSVLKEKGRPATFYAPDKLQDGRLATAWAEGVAGPGIGEKLTFTWKSPITPKSLAIYGACSDSPRYFRENHRIKSVELTLSSGFKATFALGDVARVQRFPLTGAKPFTTATLSIREVFKGTKYDDTCVAEAFFE